MQDWTWGTPSASPPARRDPERRPPRGLRLFYGCHQTGVQPGCLPAGTSGGSSGASGLHVSLGLTGCQVREALPV